MIKKLTNCVGNDGVFWLLKTSTSLEGDISVTGADENVRVVRTEESEFLVQGPGGLPRTLMRSGSLQPLKTPSKTTPLPSSPHESLTPDIAGGSVSDFSQLQQHPENLLPSRFTGQAWFQKYFADCVCTLCWYPFFTLNSEHHGCSQLLLSQLIFVVTTDYAKFTEDLPWKTLGDCRCGIFVQTGVDIHVAPGDMPTLCMPKHWISEFVMHFLLSVDQVMNYEFYVESHNKWP